MTLENSYTKIENLFLEDAPLFSRILCDTKTTNRVQEENRRKYS